MTRAGLYKPGGSRSGSGPMSTTTAHVDLCVRAQTELFGAGRLELADELIAPDCVDHGGDSRAARARA